jgi:hypothetical protein
MAADTDVLPGGFRARVDISSARHSHACEVEAFLHFPRNTARRVAVQQLVARAAARKDGICCAV